jgi:hypothetical protein
MPGCLTIFCSHSRAWEYFAETVIIGNENNFLAKKCGSLNSYDIDACIKTEIPMGIACPKSAKGNFFLRTSTDKPFGKGGKKDEKSTEKNDQTTSNSSTPKSPETTTTKKENDKKDSTTKSSVPTRTKKN